MQLREWKRRKVTVTFSLCLKSGVILLLLFLSILVVACSDTSGSTTTTTNTNNLNLNGPPVTVTIRLGNQHASPTPSLAPYWCGAWATQATPGLNAGTVMVYAKLTQNVNGNPVGVDGATATASVLWPDGSATFTATTTPDGLAVFPVTIDPNKTNVVNKVTLVTVTFSKAGMPNCAVDDTNRDAFFVIVMPTPTPTPTPDNNNNNNNNGN